MVKRSSWLIPLVIVVFYLATHLYQLTLLPVFADESIYIRWSQLMIDDGKQYAFFPLNDGKTPLHMWLMVPFLAIGKDPLWMARLLSVLAGVAQLFVIGAIIRTLKGRTMTAWVGMGLTTILPFWYFHHRMALIDPLLTLWLSLVVLGLLKLVQHKNRPQLLWTGVTGLSFGLALLSKVPAVLFLPAFPLYALAQPWRKKRELVHRLLLISVSVVIGLSCFVLLKIHPAFGQLFARGGDFLHPWRYVFLEGGWLSTIQNIPTYLWYGLQYLTFPVLVFMVFGLFSPDEYRRRQQHLLFWSAIVFAAPIVLMGKVVYPRYFLPVSIFATVMTALSLETMVEKYIEMAPKLWQKLLGAILVALLVANLISQSLGFMTSAITNPATLPLVSADKEQYLHEWSSGHGITQTVTRIQDKAKEGTIAVATEGTFGTLPDAVLMYLHASDVSNIYIEGIGWPVKGVPVKFADRAQGFDTVWLVVNSHRKEFMLQDEALVTEYCRPNNAPCLQIWDITTPIKSGNF